MFDFGFHHLLLIISFRFRIHREKDWSSNFKVWCLLKEISNQFLLIIHLLVLHHLLSWRSLCWAAKQRCGVRISSFSTSSTLLPIEGTLLLGIPWTSERTWLSETASFFRRNVLLPSILCRTKLELVSNQIGCKIGWRLSSPKIFERCQQMKSWCPLLVEEWTLQRIGGPRKELRSHKSCPGRGSGKHRL